MLKMSLVFAAMVGLSFSVFIPTEVYASSGCLNHKHTGTGKGPSKKSAKWAARQKWKFEVVKHKHNPLMGSWWKSAEQSSSCKRKYGVYTCKVQAFPCKIKPTEFDQPRARDKKGINGSGFSNWCKKKYRKSKRAELVGQTAGDWVCVMKNGSHKPISVTEACKLQYGLGQVYKAKAEKWSDPNSWKCYIR